MLITDLGDCPEWIEPLARWHFDQFGPLTGADTFEGYRALLTAAATSRTVPSVLIAVDEDKVIGSANLVACDFPPRPELTPWLGQLVVKPEQRGQGIGAALVRAVLARAGGFGHRQVYLYTGGTLPEYYDRLGWRELAQVPYLGRERVIMSCDTGSSQD
jgi:GNAT superfamily N-acetyltransferase